MVHHALAVRAVPEPLAIKASSESDRFVFGKHGEGGTSREESEPTRKAEFFWHTGTLCHVIEGGVGRGRVR